MFSQDIEYDIKLTRNLLFELRFLALLVKFSLS